MKITGELVAYALGSAILWPLMGWQFAVTDLFAAFCIVRVISRTMCGRWFV